MRCLRRDRAQALRDSQAHRAGHESQASGVPRNSVRCLRPTGLRHAATRRARRERARVLSVARSCTLAHRALGAGNFRALLRPQARRDSRGSSRAATNPGRRVLRRTRQTHRADLQITEITTDKPGGIGDWPEARRATRAAWPSSSSSISDITAQPWLPHDARDLSTVLTSTLRRVRSKCREARSTTPGGT